MIFVIYRFIIYENINRDADITQHCPAHVAIPVTIPHIDTDLWYIRMQIAMLT